MQAITFDRAPTWRRPLRMASIDAPGTQFKLGVDAPEQIEAVVTQGHRLRQRQPFRMAWRRLGAWQRRPDRIDRRRRPCWARREERGMEQIQWRPADLAAAGLEARSAGKLVLVDFFSPT